MIENQRKLIEDLEPVVFYNLLLNFYTNHFKLPKLYSQFASFAVIILYYNNKRCKLIIILLNEKSILN